MFFFSHRMNRLLNTWDSFFNWIYFWYSSIIVYIRSHIFTLFLDQSKVYNSSSWIAIGWNSITIHKSFNCSIGEKKKHTMRDRFLFAERVWKCEQIIVRSKHCRSGISSLSRWLGVGHTNFKCKIIWSVPVYTMYFYKFVAYLGTNMKLPLAFLFCVHYVHISYCALFLMNDVKELGLVYIYNFQNYFYSKWKPQNK